MSHQVHEPTAGTIQQSSESPPSPPVHGHAVPSRAMGALALGALAMGAVALGALAVGRLAIGRARIRRLEIDDLVVRKLRVTGDLEVSAKGRPVD